MQILLDGAAMKAPYYLLPPVSVCNDNTKDMNDLAWNFVR